MQTEYMKNISDDSHSAEWPLGGPQKEVKQRSSLFCFILSLYSPGQGCASSLMFVRLRQKPQPTKKKGFAALELGKAKPTACRDAWFTLQQDR